MSHDARVLVVDDDPDILENLQDWLEESGYEVQTAASGIEAIALARQTPFDVVVTDLMMPKLSGLHLLNVLKELDGTLEVIFLTGQATLTDAIAALRQGQAFDFFLKPLKELEQLNVSIEKALMRRRKSLAPAAKAEAPMEPALREVARSLNARERSIALMLLQGLRAREIADKFSLSERTVRNLLSSLYSKLRVADRTEAVIFCQQPGFAQTIAEGTWFP